jgi:predicted esterase
VEEHRLVTRRRARYYTIGGGGAGKGSGAGAASVEEVWIVLHGHGQLASVFLGYFKSIAAPGRVVVAPEALNRYYVEGTSGRSQDAKVATTWMTRMDRDNEIVDYVDFLDAVWGETAARAARVTALGFSQGVATACRWVARGTSRVDHLIAWAGQLPPDVEPAAFTKLSGGVTLVTGATDEYATWIAEGNPASRLEAAGIKPEVLSFEGGHRMDRVTLEAIAGVPARTHRGA